LCDMTALQSSLVRGSAGERTRTSKGIAHRVLNPARLPVPPHPRDSKDRAAGNQLDMATPEEREQESRESDVTKFEEQLDEDREEQREAAERIAEPLEPQDEDSGD
jgi:hypothetical protein